MHTGLRRRSQEASATREKILARAVQIASVRGLSGTSIGDLAEAVGMSKSGLFAHFSSKEQLEIAVLEEAARIFRQHVIEPAEALPAGLPRLRALLLNDIDYTTGRVLEGGCFFSSAAHELDGRDGPVRERLIAILDDWEALLQDQLRAAIDNGEVRADVDRVDFLFLTTGLALATNWVTQLRRAPDRAKTDARSLTEKILKNIATQKGLELLSRA